MWIPKALYEMLPYLYLLVGCSAAFMPEVFGRVSGVMLCVAAGIIIKMRRTYRKEVENGN